MIDRPEGNRTVGRVPFTDGVTRDADEDDDGRQWVSGDDGERVYGAWLPPPNEPLGVALANPA